MSSPARINILGCQRKTSLNRVKQTRKILSKIIPLGETELNSAEMKDRTIFKYWGGPVEGTRGHKGRGKVVDQCDQATCVP